MKKSRSMTASQLFTARAPLAVLGLKLRSLKLFETISQHVQIKQKTIKHTPLEKLTDAFIAILSGAHGLSEINTRVRSDREYVREWVDDPRHADRQLGWVEAGSPGYVREVRRLVMRWRKRNGHLCHHLLLSTLTPFDVMQLKEQPVEMISNPAAVAVAYVRLYDERGGSVEIELKESKQGLEMTKRNKKRFAAQQMVVLLGRLAHNVVVWAKRWLLAEAPKLKRYGVPRLVRDVFQGSGFLELKATGGIKRIVLNQASALARHS